MKPSERFAPVALFTSLPLTRIVTVVPSQTVVKVFHSPAGFSASACLPSR